MVVPKMIHSVMVIFQLLAILDKGSINICVDFHIDINF